MSGRDLVDEMRSGIRAMTHEPRRVGLFDIVAAGAALAAMVALGYVGYGAWVSPKGPRPPAAPVIAVVAPVPTVQQVAWTEKDEAACNAKARAAADNPNTGSYMITNYSISEGVAALATKVECELMAKPRRFCGADGTAKVVAIVNDYVGRMDLIRLGLAAQGAPMAFAGGMLGGEAAAGDAVYDSMKSDTLAYMKDHDQRIVAAIRKLGSGGVIKADDFRPFTFAGVPARIQAIFEGVVVSSTLCV